LRGKDSQEGYLGRKVKLCMGKTKRRGRGILKKRSYPKERSERAGKRNLGGREVKQKGKGKA